MEHSVELSLLSFIPHDWATWKALVIAEMKSNI